MTTERERYLLERCLRLEVELAQARGMYIAPLLPQIERTSLYETAPHYRRAAPRVTAPPAPPDVQGMRRYNRRATANDIAEMRKLRRSGLSPAQVGKKVQLSDTTVRRFTADVLLEREINAT